MTGSLRVEISELSKLAGLLDTTHDQLLASAGAQAAGAQVGNAKVADALNEFYTNWDYRRRGLAERLGVLGTLLFKAADIYAENERMLKQGFSPQAGEGDSRNDPKPVKGGDHPWTGTTAKKATNYQAPEQRNASAAGGAVAGAGAGAGSSGPKPVAYSTETDGVDSKSGAVVRGTDGSEITYRKMSDGTFEVTVKLANGTTVDFGDAKELFDIAHGEFFSGPGVKWDVDASLTTDSATTFSFANEANAHKFFEALGKSQNSAASHISGMTWGDVSAATKGVEGIGWTGFRNATHLSASGSIGIDSGNTSQGAGTSVSVSKLQGFATTTVSSDGSKGTLSIMGGEVSAGGHIRVGDYDLKGEAGTGYERQVHLIRDRSGTPVRLEVEENYTASAQATGGIHFLGTGVNSQTATVGSLTSTTSFDLKDPGVHSAFTGSTDASSLYSWSKEHASLGGQTVSSYSGSSSGSSSSLLFSGEWSKNHASSTLVGSTYRAPGSSSFESYLPDMRSQDGMNAQIVKEADGSTSVVRLGTF